VEDRKKPKNKPDERENSKPNREKRIGKEGTSLKTTPLWTLMPVLPNGAPIKTNPDQWVTSNRKYALFSGRDMGQSAKNVSRASQKLASEHTVPVKKRGVETGIPFRKKEKLERAFHYTIRRSWRFHKELYSPPGIAPTPMAYRIAGEGNARSHLVEPRGGDQTEKEKTSCGHSKREKKGMKTPHFVEGSRRG